MQSKERSHHWRGPIAIRTYPYHHYLTTYVARPNNERLVHWMNETKIQWTQDEEEKLWGGGDNKKTRPKHDENEQDLDLQHTCYIWRLNRPTPTNYHLLHHRLGSRVREGVLHQLRNAMTTTTTCNFMTNNKNTTPRPWNTMLCNRKLVGNLEML